MFIKFLTRRTGLGLLFAGVIYQIFVLPNQLQAKEFRVCESCQWTNLSQTIAQASSGDTVFVEGGRHRVGKLVLDKPITLRGQNGAVIDGLGQGHVIDMQADDITIEGLIIENSGVSDIREYAGIHGESVRRCTIRSNTLKNITYGIYLARSHECVIEQNFSQGNAKDEVLGGNGIHLWNSADNRLIANTFIEHRDGLYFEFSENLTIKENLARRNLRYGLHFMFCHSALVEKNVFQENTTGVALMYSKHLTITQNKFNDSKGPSMQGMLLKDIDDSRIQNNEISQNTTGFVVDNSSRNLIRGNRFQKNGIAFEIYGNSQRNTIQSNIFVRNTFDVATNTRDSNNTYQENYWDRYRGYDLDRDGRGDVPYAPVQIFSFWVSKYPELSLLAGSPMLYFLELMERVFPVLTPLNLKDNAPLMHQNLVNDQLLREGSLYQ